MGYLNSITEACCKNNTIEEGHIKDGGTRLKGLKYNRSKNRQVVARDCWEWKKNVLEAKVHNGL
jgi:hypothetical protein